MTRVIPRDETYFRTRSEEDENGCWNWKLFSTKPAHGRGGKYGHCRDPRTGKPIGAHRLAYRELVGEIPDGYEIDHTCDNSLCCNPAHLKAVTPSKNNQRKWDAGRGANQNSDKMLCPKCGEPYTMVSKRGDGRTFRSCRPCVKAYQAAYHKRRKAASDA